MFRTYTYRLYPNKNQKVIIERTFGCCRFVWNSILAKRIELWKTEKKQLSAYKCSSMLLTPMKHNEDTKFLQEVDAQALLYTLSFQQQAYQAFFRRLKKGNCKAGFPKFKKKHEGEQSYRTKSKIYIKNNKIVLHKLGHVKIRGKNEIQGRIVAATVKRTADFKYYVTVCYDIKEIPLLPKTSKHIGIDLGLRHFIVTSNGEEINKPDYQQIEQKKIRRFQRKIDRKPISSKNRMRARRKYAQVMQKIKCRRKDFIHKTSKRLCECYDVICVEDLRPSEMMGTFAKPVVRRLVDATFGNFLRQLTYKAEWYGKKLIFIDKFYPSSQICSSCGFQHNRAKDMHLIKWKCPKCGVVHHRDINAAKNILSQGLKQISNRGVDSRIDVCRDCVKPEKVAVDEA